MIAAHLPIQRPSNAKILIVDGRVISSTGPGPSSQIYCAPAMWWSPTMLQPCQRVFPDSIAAPAAELKYVLRAVTHSMRSGSFLLSSSGRVTSARAQRVGLDPQPRFPVTDWS
jgi:hypothetical protein